MDSKGGVCVKMSLNNVAGTIGTVVGLGVTLGALGLALEFTDRAFDRAAPRRNGKRRKRQPLFDFGSEMQPRRTKSRRRTNDVFGGDLF